MKLGCFQSTRKHLVYNFICIITKSYGSCLNPVQHKMGGIPIIHFYFKKTFQFIDLNKQTFIMVHFFFSQGLRYGLAAWFCLRVFHEITEEFGPEFSSHLKVCLGLKDSFPRWLTQWLFTEDFSFLSHGSLHRATWASSQYGTWLSLQWSIREQGRNHDVFYDLNLEIIHYHFYNI